MTPLKVGSLFAGYGGLDLGIQQVLDAETEWFCEFDEAPSKILKHHWPAVPNYGDVTKIDWETVPPVDIIAGGSPCQDLSQAGKRAGMTEGTRSNLWVNMRESIRVVRPRLVVWENVRGALSATATSESDMEQREGLLGKRGSGHLRALGRVLGDFTDIGYDAAWTTVRASDIGAPHHRARVFLIAWPGAADADRGDEHRGHRVAAPPEHPSPGGDLGIFPDPHGIGLEARQQRSSESGEEIPIANCGGETLSHASGIRREWAGASRTGRAGFTDCHNRDVEWGEYAPAVRRWERVVGPAPAPTEQNSRGNPRLNPEFASWMMGLPSGHVTAPEIELTRAQQLKALGNGVVPQQAAAALRVLLGSDF